MKATIILITLLVVVSGCSSRICNSSTKSEKSKITCNKRKSTTHSQPVYKSQYYYK